MEGIAIVPDINVIMTYCFNRRCEGFSKGFIYLLERHPKLGIITSRIGHRVLKQLKDANVKDAYYRFYELKECLKAEKIDNPEYERMREVAKDFFYRLGSTKLHPHTPLVEIGLEDVERVAELACIEPNHEVLYFASLDSDFVSPENSKAIEDKFKFKADYPVNILSEVKPII